LMSWPVRFCPDLSVTSTPGSAASCPEPPEPPAPPTEAEPPMETVPPAPAAAPDALEPELPPAPAAAPAALESEPPAADWLDRLPALAPLPAAPAGPPAVSGCDGSQPIEAIIRHTTAIPVEGLLVLTVASCRAAGELQQRLCRQCTSVAACGDYVPMNVPDEQ